MNICVLIPSYNEAKTIGSLVKEIKTRGFDVVVVDDGSIDQTAKVAEQAGAYLLRHEKNKGKGASLKNGFHYVLKRNYDAVITMDGDGQHSPEDISKFIKALNDSDVDMVVGNRMAASKGMPVIRWLTNHFTSFLISTICCRSMPDSQCGFRLIKRDLLKELDLNSANYEIESETLIAAHHKGFKIKFIPAQTIYTKQTSGINPIVDTIRFFKFIFRVYCPFLFKKK